MAVVAYVVPEGTEEYLAYRAGTFIGQIVPDDGIWFAWCFSNQATKAFRKVRDAKMWLEGQVKNTTEVR